MAVGSRPTKPNPLTNEHVHFYNLLEKRLRAPAHEPELFAYGQREVLWAVEAGAVSALLSVGPVVKPLLQAVKSCGGVILEFHDPASTEHQRLSQLGGVAATLRFEARLEEHELHKELSSTSKLSKLTAPQSDAEKPVIKDETSFDQRNREKLSVAPFIERQDVVDEDNAVASLNEAAAEEIGSMNAIYPDDFAFVPSTKTCLLSVNSSCGRKSAVVEVELNENYPHNAPAKPRLILRSFGVSEEGLLEGARATCDSTIGEPALFELMIFLIDAVNAPADTNARL